MSKNSKLNKNIALLCKELMALQDESAEVIASLITIFIASVPESMRIALLSHLYEEVKKIRVEIKEGGWAQDGSLTPKT